LAEGQFVMRPMSITEVVDEAVSMYRRNFGVLFGIALAPYLLVYLISAILTAQIMTAPAPTEVDMVRAMIPLLLMVMVMLIGQEVSGAAMTSAVSERVLGRPASIGASYARVGRRIGPFIGYIILKSVIVAIGMVFCIVPGIILMSLYLVSVCAFMIEGKGSTESLSRSWNLTSGFAMKAFGLAILIGIIGYIISFAVGAVFGLITSGAEGVAASATGDLVSKTPGMIVVEYLITGLASAFVAPLFAAAVTIFYYDLRVRREGFDLQVLAENLSRG